MNEYSNLKSDHSLSLRSRIQYFCDRNDDNKVLLFHVMIGDVPEIEFILNHTTADLHNVDILINNRLMVIFTDTVNMTLIEKCSLSSKCDKQ